MGFIHSKSYWPAAGSFTYMAPWWMCSVNIPKLSRHLFLENLQTNACDNKLCILEVEEKLCVSWWRLIESYWELMKVRKLNIIINHNTVKNTVNSPDFLVWKFSGKAQFPHDFGRIAQNYAETVPFCKFPHQEIRWNYGIFCSVMHDRIEKLK